MNVWTRITTTRAAIAVCLATALPVLAQAAPPSLLQLQGRLTDSAGQPITSTQRDLRVEFWTLAVGGTSLGTSTVVDPTITNGIYAVTVTAPAGMFAGNASVFMEIAVGSGVAGADGAFEVLSPRTRVLASAYALNADTLDGLDSSSFAQASNSFVQNGNAFGGLATLGTNDAFGLVLETAGAERVRVDTTGAVSLQGNTLTFANPSGSGTVSTVANAQMTVSSSGAGTLFLEAGATGATRMRTGGADRLYIENNGNVGIGTTAPGSRLGISGNATVGPTYAALAGPPNGLAVEGNIGAGTPTPAVRVHAMGRFRSQGAPPDDATPDIESALELSNRGAGGAEYIWRTYTAAVGGGFGVNPNSYEVWEYPQDATPSCCIPRFRILDSGSQAAVPGEVVIDRAGNLGVNTATPAERLEVNGAIRFTPDGSVISRAPRVVRSEDPRGGCPPAWPANTDLWTQAITLNRAGSVHITAHTIRAGTGRHDLQLFVDGIQRDQTLTFTSPADGSQWAPAYVGWSGTLAAGAHTISLRSPSADVWGCGPTWGSIDTVVFE